jgi:hypothetical protein
MPRKYIPQVCHFAEPEKLLWLVVSAKKLAGGVAKMKQAIIVLKK